MKPHAIPQSQKETSGKSEKSEKPQPVDEKVEITIDTAPVPMQRSRRDGQEKGKAEYFNPQDSFASSGGEEEPVAERKKTKSALKTKAKPTASTSGAVPKAATSPTPRHTYSVITNMQVKHPFQQVVTVGLSILIGLYCIYWCLERHRIGYCDMAHEEYINGTQGWFIHGVLFARLIEQKLIGKCNITFF
jgi:hypothetical protein